MRRTRRRARVIGRSVSIHLLVLALLAAALLARLAESSEVQLAMAERPAPSGLALAPSRRASAD